MTESLTIRPAQPDDVEAASALLYSAYRHKQVSFPLIEEHDSWYIKHAQSYFRANGNRFSYQNVLVAVQDLEVVGLVLSFGGRDEQRLNAAVEWQLEHEAEDDEWYIDALAVFSNWGRKGIGTRLMQTAEQLAHQHHYTKIALNVAQDNKPAFSLYQHLHYVVTKETLLYHQPYIRMVKTLASG
jgi:ribosomal protein S18 acetylase RimI-like enzyme